MSRNFPETTEAVMLGSMPVIAFVPCTAPAQVRPFYEGVLQLHFVSEDEVAIVFRMGDVMLRVVNVAGVPGHEAAQFTILGWAVPDIDGMVGQLMEKGVQFVRYPGMNQDALGVWSAPSGARVAWFKDPFGNVLSLTELRDAT